MYNDANDPRRAAARSLISCENDGRYSNLEINTVLTRTSMSDSDRGLYTALVYGVIERLITLDYIVSLFSSRPLGDIDGETKTALRLGIYQLAFMDKIPPHAAVNESVALAPKRSRAFVNAVLRSFLRSDCKFNCPDKETAVTEYLSVKYSFPTELVDMFIDIYGTDVAESILAASLTKHDVSLRVNTLKTTADELASELDGAVRSPYSDEIVLVKSAKEALTGIQSGRFFIQDEASLIASKIVGAKPGETVIDVCAAPGGKSFSMAIDMKNEGVLYSFDLHRNKLSLISSGAQRLGISIIKTDRHDARTPLDELRGSADRVLCDAPCSGLGVIAKKPEVKYKSLSDIRALPDIQLDVLRGASAYVKPGGILVYSTCTLNPSENEEVVKRFLNENPDFSPESFCYGNVASDCGSLTMLPHITGTDGFFISKMKRAAL